MFEGGGDDVPSSVPRRPGGPFDGQVVRFRSARGEYDLTGIHTQYAGRLFSAGLDGPAGILTKSMQAGGIAEHVGKKGGHCFSDFFSNRRCGAVIQVDPIHRQISAIAQNPLSFDFFRHSPYKNWQQPG